jgi:Acyclic terpene utilisation family protein AtuA
VHRFPKFDINSRTHRLVKEETLVTIGCWAAFWGDTRGGPAQLLRNSKIDYLVADYLAEITMALLARGRAKDPETGFVPEAVFALQPHLAEIHERGIKVVTNAGGLNPQACAAAFEKAVAAAGLPLKVAAVLGDDVSDRSAALAGSVVDMFTGGPVPDDLSSFNAYLGARPIAAALDAGADIVVTGRCVDAAIVLGPLQHEFGWGDNELDLLSAGSIAGHIIECGPQCTGGTFTDWDEVPGWENLGYPIAECDADGSVTITKAPDTGGMVTPATVAEQIVYEIGDPGAYVMPDVVCDWTGVELEQAGPDRVLVRGAKGSPPPDRFKATAVSQNGYRAMTTAMFAGFEAAGRARRAGDALIARSQNLLADQGLAPFSSTSLEVVGAGDLLGAASRTDSATEVVLKLGVRHAERAGIEVFAAEFAPFGLVAQGMTGIFAGRPRPAPVFETYHVLVEKSELEPRFVIEGESTAVAIAPGTRGAPVGTAPLTEPGHQAFEGRSVPLKRIAYGRSGDKGNLANIGLIARRPEFAAVIREQVTADRVADFFRNYLEDAAEIKRWEMPGLDAVNIVLTQVLGGRGGTSTLRYDPQGKSYAAMLLTMPIFLDEAGSTLLTKGVR